MTDGSGKNHMEYDCSNADRLGDDAWIGAVFFRLCEKIPAHTKHQDNQLCERCRGTKQRGEFSNV